MKQTPAVIFAGDSAWKVGRKDAVRDVPSAAGATPDQIAEAVVASFGSKPESVILALPTSWCLSATVSLEGVPSRNRRNALLYRLELLVPFSAELMTVDYLPDEPKSALAICVSNSTVKPYTDAFEAAGIVVQSIVPASVCAVQSFLKTENAETADAIVWQSGSTVELFITRVGRIIGWYALPADGDDVAGHLTQWTARRTSPFRVDAIVEDPNLLDRLRAVHAVIVDRLEYRPIADAVLTTVGHGAKPMIDLRRDGLSSENQFGRFQKTYKELALAVAALLVCVCAAACWRAVRLEQSAAANRDQQARFFGEAFPGRPVPANIVTRLKSEERGMLASQSTPAAALPSVAPTLYSVLSAIAGLTPDARIQIQDLRLDGSEFAIDGQARNRADVSQLSDVLNRSGQLQAAPAQTEQSPGKGIHFTLTGIDRQESKPR